MIKLAWRNIWRNNRRTSITIASVFAAVLFSILTISLSNGSWNKLIDNLLRTQVGHIQVHQKGYWNNKMIDNYMTMDQSTIEQLKKIPGITNVSPRIETFAMISSDEVTKGVGIVAIDPVQEDHKSSLSQRLTAGSYLRQDDDGVLLGKGLSDYLRIGVGDTVALMGQGYHGTTAVGLFPVRGIVTLIIPEMDKGFVYTTIPAAQKYIDMPDGYSGILLSIDKDDNLEKLRQEVIAHVDMSKYEVLSWRVAMETLVNQSQANKIFSRIIMFILYVIVGFGILGTVIMMTNERRHEFGVVVALGMKRQKLAQIVSMELLFITFIGTLLAIAVSLPITFYFSYYPIELTGELAEIALGYGMEPVIPTDTKAAIYINQALVILFVSCVTITYPIGKILRLKVNNAIRP